MGGDNALSWVDVKGVVTGLATNIIWAGPAAAYFIFKLANRFFARIYISVVWRVIGFELVATLVFWAAGGRKGAILFSVVGTILLLSTWLALRGLAATGILDAFSKTTEGIGYAASLRKARHSISFLGIGADKLTSLKEFPAAMERCGTNGRKVRLLLSTPDNPLLGKVAKRNDADPGKYGERVKKSLRRIADIKADKDLDIEVRFYPASEDRDYQQFRLMFIDEVFCLLSWTVWGLHIGNSNPQVILKNDRGANPQRGAYKAFQDYFDALWEGSAVIDWTKYK